MESNTFLKGAMIGLAAGIVAGILLAPKSGKEMRHKVKEITEDVTDKISDKMMKLSGNENLSEDLMDFEESTDLNEKQKTEIKSELKKCFARIKQISEK